VYVALHGTDYNSLTTKAELRHRAQCNISKSSVSCTTITLKALTCVSLLEFEGVNKTRHIIIYPLIIISFWQQYLYVENTANFKGNKNKLYNTPSLPALLYGSENWTIKSRDARRITAAEMKYMRNTIGYTWTDYKTKSLQKK